MGGAVLRSWSVRSVWGGVDVGGVRVRGGGVYFLRYVTDRVR